MIPELADPGQLREWVDAGLSIRRIAEKIGCSKSSVEIALRRYGLSRRRVRVPDDMKKKLGM